MGDLAQICVILTNLALLPAIGYACWVVAIKKDYSFTLEAATAMAVLAFGVVFHICDVDPANFNPDSDSTLCIENICVNETSCAFTRDENKFEILQRASFEATYTLVALIAISLANIKPFVAKFFILGAAYVVIHFGFKDDRRFKTERFLFAFLGVFWSIGWLFARILIDFRSYRHNNSEINKSEFIQIIASVAPLKQCLIPATVLMLVALVGNFGFADNHFDTPKSKTYLYVHAWVWQFPFFLSFYFIYKFSYVWNQQKQKLFEDKSVRGY
uniref:Uncharacterized protein n=1 Tax=Aplanochytrium stocchinoi TaxID=215587 RepID=A0A7S3PJ83_9STRA